MVSAAEPRTMKHTLAAILTLIMLTQCSNTLGYNYADQFLKTHGAQYRIIGDRVYTTR